MATDAKEEKRQLHLSFRVGQCAYFGGDYAKAVELLAPLAKDARVIVERFRLDHQISRSVNSEVWQAFDLKSSAVVAVKLIQSRFMAGENFGVRCVDT